MEFRSPAVGMTGKRSGLGHCQHFFWLGVVFDTVGVAVLFVGVFADVVFFDMLLYLGALIIFSSLLWWVSWYSGNIELHPEDALPKEPRRGSDSGMHALRRSVSLRFSQTFASFTDAIGRLRRRRLRGSLLRPSLRTSQTLEVPCHPGGVREKGVEDSDRTKDVGEEDSGPVPEDPGRSEAADSPAPAVAERTYVECPMFPMFSTEWRPPLPLWHSRSLPVTPSALQPGALPISKSEVVFPLTSADQPSVALPLTSQFVPSVVDESHPPVPVFSQDHFQVPVAAQSHLLEPVASQSQNLPPSPQTQSFSVQDSESQTLTSQASVMPLSPSQSFQNMDLQSSQSTQDFVAISDSQHFSSKSSLLPMSSSQSSALLEISKNIVAQVFESLSLSTQKLPQ